MSVFSPILSDVEVAAPTWQTEATTLGAAMVLAVLCALLAAAFVQLAAALYALKKRHHAAVFFRYPFFSVTAVVLATALAVYPRLVGTSMGQPLLATVRSLFARRSIADRAAFDWGPFHPLAALAVMLAARFVLTAAAVPLPMPVGLYATNIVIGAVFGRLVGECATLLGISVDPNGLRHSPLVRITSPPLCVHPLPHPHSDGNDWELGVRGRRDAHAEQLGPAARADGRRDIRAARDAGDRDLVLGLAPAVAVDL